jgi:hypothetical protein
MQRHLVIVAILILGAWGQAGRLGAQRVDQPANKPNVVLVMMDDQYLDLVVKLKALLAEWPKGHRPEGTEPMMTLGDWPFDCGWIVRAHARRLRLNAEG